jgi:hypothetical protein
MAEHEFVTRKMRRLIFPSLFAFPFFAVINPVSFYLGYINCFVDTAEQFVYAPNFKTFFTIAFTVFLIMTFLKYLLYRVKRKIAQKPQSLELFILFHAASQLPYVLMIGIVINNWGPRDLNDIKFGFFLWYFVVGIGTWIISFGVFNLLTYTYPRDWRGSFG